MAAQLITVEPLFIKEVDMPSADISPFNIVRAITRVISPQAVDGVQRIGRLWRLYFKSLTARLEMMSKKTVLIQGKMVPLYEQNPFKTNQRTPEDRKDKLTIKGLPLSVSNDEVQNLLESKKVVLSSQVKYGYMRDESGALTAFKNGDRFVYCEPFNPPIPRQQKICDFHCLVFHHGKDNNQCKSCNILGHRSGDPQCPARAADNTILAFSGYQHPLSNHFLTPIKAFSRSRALNMRSSGRWPLTSKLTILLIGSRTHYMQEWSNV